MSWHKAGFTERMANIMLAEAVLVTDDTAYLNGRYNENDMLVFQLNQLEKLPSKIQKLLSDDKKRSEIAENGRKKTREAHTWQKRAQRFCRFFIGNRIKNLLRDRRIMPILIIVFTERKSYRSGSVYHGR